MMVVTVLIVAVTILVEIVMMEVTVIDTVCKTLNGKIALLKKYRVFCTLI
jgi:hypothetical protein